MASLTRANAIVTLRHFRTLCFAALIGAAVPAAHSDAFESLQSDTDATPPLRISHIVINGNVKTKESVVRLHLGIDTGTVFDSLLVADARLRLEKSSLFSRVAILNIVKPEGVHLYVILTERKRLSISDIGGELYSRRYGHDDSIWKLWSAYLGLKFSNFRGRGETFHLFLRLWEWRALSVNWQKPFLLTPYFISAGLSISDYPYEYRPWRTLSVRARATGGRKVLNHSTIYASLYPAYSHIDYHGPSTPGTLTVDTQYDTAWAGNAAINDRDMLNTLSWSDTARIEGTDSIRVTSWSGNRGWEKDQGDQEFYELLAVFGHHIDKTDKAYPLSGGWYLRNQIGYNYPFSGRIAAKEYIQLNTDFRVYHRMPPRNSSMAYRAQMTLRNTEGGSSHRVIAGNERTIRGYGAGALGVSSQANNRLLLTAEYRIRLLQSGQIGVPSIANFYTSYTALSYRFDAAIFCDYAHLWHQVQHPLTGEETGLTFGTGIRMLVLPLNRAICYDLVPVLFYKGEMISRLTDTRTWGWHLYIDLSF